jgi:hypothetical protein
MTEQNVFQQNIHRSALGKRVLQGAGLALTLVTAFLVFILIAADKSEFGAWVFVPMLTVTVAGACGGILYYVMDFLRYHGGWKKAVANVLTGMVYIVALYLSLVIGLAQVGLWH